MKILKVFLLILLLIALVASIVCWIVFTVNDEEVKTLGDADRIKVPGKFVSLQDGITHYDDAGADTAKTIVFIHGSSVPYYIWDNIYDTLVKRGYHVVRYDEYGRGYSDRPNINYTPEVYRRQLFNLITALKIKTPVTLAAVSFGGAVAADFTVHYSRLVNKLILADPVYTFNHAGWSPFTDNVLLAIFHEKQATGQADDFKYPNHFPDWVNKYKAQMQFKGFRHSLISTMYHYKEETIKGNYRLLNQQHKDILLIWGRADKTVPFNFSDSLRRILNVRFFPVDDAGHLPFLERPGIVSRQIVSFLKE